MRAPAPDSCLSSVPTSALVFRSTQEVPVPASSVGGVRGALMLLGARLALLFTILVLHCLGVVSRLALVTATLPESGFAQASEAGRSAVLTEQEVARWEDHHDGMDLRSALASASLGCWLRATVGAYA